MKKIISVLSVILLVSGFAFAHSLWITMEKYQLKPGEKATYFIGYGHKYLAEESKVMNQEESYQKMFKKIVLVTPEGRQSVLVPVKGTGTFKVEREGVYVLCLKSERKANEPYGPSGKYAKALIQVGDKNNGFSYRCGFRIELIPLKDPYFLKAGEYLPVKVLFEGKPLSTFVYGTYAGYRPVEDAFPVIARSNKEGIARIKITSPGEWMIFVSHHVDYSATLTFKVK